VRSDRSPGQAAVARVDDRPSGAQEAASRILPEALRPGAPVPPVATPDEELAIERCQAVGIVAETVVPVVIGVVSCVVGPGLRRSVVMSVSSESDSEVARGRCGSRAWRRSAAATLTGPARLSMPMTRLRKAAMTLHRHRPRWRPALYLVIHRTNWVANGAGREFPISPKATSARSSAIRGVRRERRPGSARHPPAASLTLGVTAVSSIGVQKLPESWTQVLAGAAIIAVDTVLAPRRPFATDHGRLLSSRR
jgi:hypothetical protein